MSKALDWLAKAGVIDIDGRHSTLFQRGGCMYAARTSLSYCRKIKGWRPSGLANPDNFDAASVLVRLSTHQLSPLLTNGIPCLH